MSLIAAVPSRTPADYNRMLAHLFPPAPPPPPPAARTRLIVSASLIYELAERDEPQRAPTARHEHASCRGVGGVCFWRCINDPDDLDRKRRIPSFCERHRDAKRAVDRANVKRRRMAQSAE